MPWCPKCRAEYLPQITRCPDCQVELVAELPEEHAESEEFEQILLCTVEGDTHRALLQDALQAEGIPSRSQRRTDAYFPARAGYPAPLVDIFGIYVNRRDLERARAIYQAYEQASEG